jgi:hypothetical protein
LLPDDQDALDHGDGGAGDQHPQAGLGVPEQQGEPEDDATRSGRSAMPTLQAKPRDSALALM